MLSNKAAFFSLFAHSTIHPFTYPSYFIPLKGDQLCLSCSVKEPMDSITAFVLVTHTTKLAQTVTKKSMTVTQKRQITNHSYLNL